MSYHNITTNQNQDHRDGVMSPRTTNVTMGINGANGVQGTNSRPNSEKPAHPGLKKEEVPTLNKEIITHQTNIKDKEINQNIVMDTERIHVPDWNNIRYELPNPLLSKENTSDRTIAQLYFNPNNLLYLTEFHENLDVRVTAKYSIDDTELSLLGTFKADIKQVRSIVKFPLTEEVVIAVDQHIRNLYFINRSGILDTYSLFGMDYNTLAVFLRKMFDLGALPVHNDFNIIVNTIIVGRMNRTGYALYEGDIPDTEESNVHKLLKK